MSTGLAGLSKRDAAAEERRSVSKVERVLSGRILAVMVLSLVAGWLPALLGSGEMARVAGMYGLSAGPNPYFLPAHGWRLYILTPLIAVSSFLLYLSPGALLVLAFGKARSAAEWVVLAFGSSLMLSIILSTGAKLVPGTSFSFSILLILWLSTAALGVTLLAFRAQRAAILWPVIEQSDIRRVVWMIGASFVGIAALAPKIFWENFNVDGIEAFEFGRSLTAHILPYWDIQDGVFGFYHNFVLFAYPNNWFITLFGPVEAAARLPFILYLVVLFAALVLLIERAAPRKLTWIEEAVLWLGLALYTVVQVYNTNYEPFFADIAEMAATDTLQVVCFLAACHALWAKRRGWFWTFALMTYLATPGGLLLLGALTVLTVLLRPPDLREQLAALCGVILVCLLIGFVHQALYNRVVLGGVNDQFSAWNMLRRLYPPTLTEFVRLNALVFASGILPALSLLVAVWRRDRISLMIAGITIVYFGVIYIQAWTAVHQFTPAMILPLVVFWRVYLGSPLAARRWLLPAVAATTLISLFLSLPRHFQVFQATRQFGLATEYRLGDYERSYEQAVGGGWSLSMLLPRSYRLQYPEQPWGCDPHSWIFYATREKPAGTRINYVVQAESDPPPVGAGQIATGNGVSVFVYDLDAWQRDRDQVVPRVSVSRLYEPILRRTYQFFRDYVERVQRQSQEMKSQEEK